VEFGRAKLNTSIVFSPRLVFDASDLISQDIDIGTE